MNAEFERLNANFALRIADQVRDHVGVEQVTHYKSTGLGTGSAIDGKSSFRDDKLARTASSDLGG